MGESGWLEARADVEEGTIVLIRRRLNVGDAAVVLDVIPVLEISLLIKLLVRVNTRTAGDATVTCSTLVATARLHAAANGAPPLGVVLHQRNRGAGEYTNRGEDAVLRDAAAVVHGAKVGGVVVRRRRHCVLV